MDTVDVQFTEGGTVFFERCTKFTCPNCARRDAPLTVTSLSIVKACHRPAMIAIESNGDLVAVVSQAALTAADQARTSVYLVGKSATNGKEELTLPNQVAILTTWAKNVHGDGQPMQLPHYNKASKAFVVPTAQQTGCFMTTTLGERFMVAATDGPFGAVTANDCQRYPMLLDDRQFCMDAYVPDCGDNGSYLVEAKPWLFFSNTQNGWIRSQTKMASHFAQLMFYRRNCNSPPSPGLTLVLFWDESPDAANNEAHEVFADCFEDDNNLLLQYARKNEVRLLILDRHGLELDSDAADE